MSKLAFKTLGGEGEDIVLIHGFGSDRLSWLATSPALMAIGKVHALDLPGHGDSSPEIGDGTPHALAAQIAVVLRANGISRAHLVGHSLGGGLAMLMAANEPVRVISLSLIAPAGLGTGVDPEFLAAYPELIDADAAMTLLRRLVVLPLLINKMTVQRVLAQLSREGVREALKVIASQLVRGEASITAAAAAVAGFDLPRLVLWGDRDTLNPLDQHQLNTFGGTGLIVANTAHLPHIENPKLVNDALVSFISRARAL